MQRCPRTNSPGEKTRSSLGLEPAWRKKDPLEGGSPLLYTSGVYYEGKLWCTKAATFQGIKKKGSLTQRTGGECGMQVHNGQRCM